jgi:hypothetical protein
MINLTQNIGVICANHISIPPFDDLRNLENSEGELNGRKSQLSFHVLICVFLFASL